MRFYGWKQIKLFWLWTYVHYLIVISNNVTEKFQGNSKKLQLFHHSLHGTDAKMYTLTTKIKHVNTKSKKTWTDIEQTSNLILQNSSITLKIKQQQLAKTHAQNVHFTFKQSFGCDIGLSEAEREPNQNSKIWKPKSKLLTQMGLSA